MFKKILFMIPIMGFILTWSGSSLAFEASLYDMHKETLYVPCVNIFDDNGTRYAVNAKFVQRGGSANFELQYITFIDEPDTECPEYGDEVSIQPVEDEVSIQPVEDDDCPNVNASNKAKANHPECTY